MENMNTTINHEIESPVEVTYLGSLADLGLGNPNGIPSELAEATLEERIAYGEKLKDAVADVTDMHHYRCIDGRNCVCNADGAQPEIRRGQVGGTGLLVEVAMNGGAPLMDTIDTQSSAGSVISQVEGDYMKKTGVFRSAHLGGCGGVNGAIVDNQTINENPAIMNVTEAIMGLPYMQKQSVAKYDATIAKTVASNAAVTAEWMMQNGWDGARYVEGITQEEPAGVEDLEVADDEFHGHKENAVLLVLSKSGSRTISEQKLKSLGLGEAFVANLDASIDMAKAMAGHLGETGVSALLTANIAKHTAVAHRLAGEGTPVYFIYLP